MSPNQNVALISVDALEERDAYGLVVSLLNQVGKYGWILLVTENPRRWRDQIADKDLHKRVVVCRLSHLKKVKGSALDRVLVIPSPRKLEEYLIEAYHLLPANGKVEVLLPFEEQVADRYVKRMVESSSQQKIPLLEKLGFARPWVQVARVGTDTLAIVMGTKAESTQQEDDDIAY